jgi:regulator of ribonuclease activity A
MNTTDLSDKYEGKLRYLAPGFRDFGGKTHFSGPVVTLTTFEDNSKVRQAVEGPGNGCVLVVDGGASMNCALFGGNLATLAEKNNWSGILINGCARDSAELIEAQIGIKALALHPKKSEKRDLGSFGLPVHIGGIIIRPNDWLYADPDGVIVADRPLEL